jgi:hypothetical protein
MSPQRLASLAILCILAACTFGAPYRIQTSSPSGVTILTDPALRNLSEVRAAAKSHCASYGRTAVQTGVSSRLRGGQAAVNFACR